MFSVPFVAAFADLMRINRAWTNWAVFDTIGNFATHQGNAAQRTRNEIAYAVEKPTEFQAVYKADLPDDQAHWHYNVDREVLLDAPAEIVYVRYVGDPGINNLRIYAHCLDCLPRATSPVVVTHTWMEDTELKTKTIELAHGTSYEVIATTAPTNLSLELAVPSK